MLFNQATLIIAIVLIVQIGATVDENSEFKIVNTENGRVRGYTSKTLLKQREIASFTGIPFAQPPVGLLRFEQAIKPKRWNRTLDALHYKSVCLQMEAGKAIGHEDCLYLNVFTPDLTFAKKLPVIFFIHGGGFYSGSGNIYGPELLLDHDIILVTFNYRLGPFGFLSLGNQDYSGNLALKDQLLALQWVHDNINSFGGDSSRVTIHGWSAGCWSVSLHMVAPASQGLFNRAICFSASALVPWIISYVKDHREIASKFANSNGAHPTNDQQLIQFLKNVDAIKLAGLAYTDFYTPGTNEKAIKLPWVPVVESVNSKNPFLTESPKNYFHKENCDHTNIDTLFGYADAESYSATSTEIQNPIMLSAFNESFLFQLPLLGLRYSYSDQDYRVMANEIRQFYFGDKVIITHIPEYSDMMSDLLSYPVHRAIKLQSKLSHGRTFYYIFSVDLKLSIFKKLSNASAYGLPGNSTHGDDIFYVFKIKNWNDVITPGTYESLSKESKEVAVIKTFTGVIANFVISGIPTPQGLPIDWKEVDSNSNDVNYVTITGDGLREDVNPKPSNYAFWDNFFVKYQHRLHVLN